MRKSLMITVAMLALAGFASADIPFFWLDKPTGRTNKNDPNSPLFVQPGSLVATNTAVAGNTPTFSSTPTQVPTNTTVPGSTFTSTPTPTQVVAATATPTQTQVPATCVTAGPGALVASFENVNCGVDEYGQGIWVSVDGFGSTASPATWAAGSQVAPPGTGNGSSYAGCMSGSMVAENGGSGVYPYCDLQIPLGAANVAIGGYSPNNGISFKFRAAVAGVQYHLYLQQGFADPFQVRFTPNNTNWNTYNVYFPTVSTSGLKFAQPSWATAQPWTTSMSRLDFGPVAITSGPLAYNFCVDDVTFNAPAAPAPYPATKLLAAEYGIGTDEWGGTITASDVDATSSISGYQGTGSSLGGGTALGSFCISGNVGAGSNPYAVGLMRLNAAGTGVNISTVSTNQSLQFSYKANTLKTFRIRISSPAITDFDYYHFDITPTDTAWHNQVIYFPGTAPAAQCFAQGGWGAAVAWSSVAANVTSMDLMVYDPAGAYDVCIDDFDFNAPAGSGGGAPVSWPNVYDGDNVPLGTNFYAAGGSVGATEVTSAGTGAGGSNTYTHITLSSAVAGYAAAGVFATGFASTGEPLTYSANAYNSVSVSVRVPSSGGGCVIPAVALLCYDPTTGVTKTSGSVNVEPYLMSGVQFMPADTWVTALIPISAFKAGVDGTGFNGKPSPTGFTLTASDFNSIDGVQVEPANYGNAGNIDGAVDVDDIVFLATSATLVAGGRTALFSDFENGTADYYGGYWSANVDSWTAADCAGYVAPPASPNLSAVTYAGVTDTTGATGSSTPCHVGRLAGWMGAENGQYGSPPCGNINAYPYLNMAANLTNDGTAHNLSDMSFLPIAVTGLKFKLKLGPTLNASMGGQVIKVFIEKTTAQQGDQFAVQIAVADLSDGNWHSYSVPFPTAAVTTRHADQASEGTVLSWKKTQYAGGAAPDAFDLTDVIQIGYGPIVRGKAFDILIDDIQFY